MADSLYSKGEQVICKKCGDHVATIARDLFKNERVTVSIFRDSEGQAPFKIGHPMRCRACNADWGRDFISGNTPRGS